MDCIITRFLCINTFSLKKKKTNKIFNSHLNTCTVEFLIYVTLYGLTSSYMLLQRTPADNRDLKYRTVQEKWKLKSQNKNIATTQIEMCVCKTLCPQRPQLYLCPYKMQKFERGITLTKSDFFSKVNQVIYSSAPISSPSSKALAQTVITISC